MTASERFDLRLEAQDDGGYDSTNEDDEYAKSSKRARYDLASKEKKDLRKHAKGDKEVLRTEASLEEGRKQRIHLNSMTAYDRHKQLINTYQLYHRGATGKLQRDTTRDRRDIDVIRQHHKFLWDDSGSDSTEETWEQQLARRYYDKLFKEYCIIDLSRYKENKFGMRWRIEREVVLGKGQFVCANKKCDDVNKLRTWEVNFGYIEDGVKKNALVKCRLCSECSYKLNYAHKKKELTKGKKKKRKKEKKKKKSKDSSSSSEESETASASSSKPDTSKSDEKIEDDIWSAPQKREEEKNREDDFNEFLEDLFM